MNVRELESSEAKLLQNFVEAHPYGSIEQSWEWGELQCSIPGREAFHVFGVFEEEKLVASALVIRQKAGLGKTWLWCPRGPLLHNGQGWAQLSSAIEACARKHGDLFLRIEPGTPSTEDFPIEGHASKTCYMPANTLMLDLSASESDILAQMAQKGRYNIKRAAKAGVCVREGGIAEIARLYEILKDTATRDGFHLHSQDFYANFVQNLGKTSKLYLAYIEGEMTGGLLATHFGNTATYYFGASSNKHRKAMAPYALQWHAIQEAKKAGCTRYDFLGIAPEGDSRHVLNGVTQFKTRFGGKRLAYHKARVLVYRTLWHLAYTLARKLRA